MVLAQHVAVAYVSFAPPRWTSLVAEPRSWLAFPVVDGQRSSVFVLPIVFNDVFGMSLMFFLSGLFVSRSIRRKGSRVFLRDRAVRLGVPFVIAAVVLTPLAYYPSYLMTTATPSVGAFRDVWLSMGIWPAGAGPAWFLWVLLCFDAIAAGLFAWSPNLEGTLGRLSSEAAERPGRVFVRVLLASMLAYVPLALIVDPGAWHAWGPFKLQTSRALLYLVYFLAGVSIGIPGVERGLLAPGGRLARGWAAWVSLAAIAFLTFGTIVLVSMDPGRSATWRLWAALAFVVSCAASSFAVLALFVRFARMRGWIMESLQENAYAMYVVHYVFVTWLQLAMLSVDLPGVTKAMLVFAATVLMSWASAAALQRIPATATAFRSRPAQ